MKKHFNDNNEVLSKLMGLGENSMQKSYYPELQEKIKELEKAEKKYHNIFENALNGIYQSTLEGKILNANPAAAHIFGYNSVESLLEAVTDIKKQLFVNPDEREEFLELITTEKKVSKYELQFYRKDGSKIWISLNAILTINETTNEKYIEGIIEEITDRKKYEEELKIAKEQAETANKAKSGFLANMSHEIRTPMNGIIGMAELLEMTDQSKEQKRYSGLIIESAESLLKIINDILDISKIEAGKIELDLIKFNLSDNLEKLFINFKVIAEKKGLKYLYNIDNMLPKEVFGDRIKLNQVLINIIGNSIKFTKMGFIMISIRKISENKDSIEILLSIEDTGIGIPENQINIIFDQFVQGDASYTKKYEGTGLGLTITHKLVKMMGGRIEVNSEEGRGSIFNVYLNIKKYNKKD